MSDLTQPLTSEELAEWRAKRPNRTVVSLNHKAPLVEDESVDADADRVVWEKPAPSFIRSGSESEVFLRLFNRLRDGYRRVAEHLVGLPNVQSQLTSGELDEWVRAKAEESTRRVYADIKPVRPDVAEIVRRDDGDVS